MILTRGPKPLKLLYSIMNLNTHILALVGKTKKNGVSYIHIFKDSKF
jgi:hypothetical protein